MREKCLRYLTQHSVFTNRKREAQRQPTQSHLRSWWTPVPQLRHPGSTSLFSHIPYSSQTVRTFKSCKRITKLWFCHELTGDLKSWLTSPNLSVLICHMGVMQTVCLTHTDSARGSPLQEVSSTFMTKDFHQALLSPVGSCIWCHSMPTDISTCTELCLYP
jgi:hypothetical protein